MRILVVGSGASGVHFALSALRKNHQVVMIDVGRAKPAPAAPDTDLIGLKSRLDDPVDYFLGADYAAASLPPRRASDRKEYYGLPPSKDYVFDAPTQFAYVQDGLAPLISFAAGGLAESWTTGSYPLNDAELAQFPISYADMAPHYGEVARRIGVIGEADDLATFFPPHDNLSAPLDLDRSGALLLERYGRREVGVRTRHGVRMGRSRQAVLSQPKGPRGGCRYCGRCLWGCPTGALYTPSFTLAECRAFPNFTYLPGLFASHFKRAASGAIEHLVTAGVDGSGEAIQTADAYVLACGTLSSSNIVLRTHYKATGEIVRLGGLMDNRQVLAPFYNLGMLGQPYDRASYQYHQLALGIETGAPDRYVHGQITTLKAGSGHPIFQSIPLDLKGAIGAFRNLRSGLGVVNLNFCDTRRDENYLTLAPEAAAPGDWPALSIRYRPAPGEAQAIKQAVAATGRLMGELGAPLVPGMGHIRPMGSSVHYSGTLPMSAAPAPWTVSPGCQSHDMDNLFVVDGSVMPFLPAKNLTFTLMANAARVAETNF
jgi:choline dehydrogenase-like flavoprotein